MHLLSSVIALMLLSTNARADLAADLLRDSDRARGSLGGGITWDSEVQTTEEGTQSKRSFRIRARGADAYVEALEPARNRGEIYLFNDRTMWFFKPSLKKPVSISARQKLAGQAANGDIASTQYARDYTPTIEKSETIAGQKMHVLMLKAKADNLTYDRIRYWINANTKRAEKAEFLTLQGQPFKRATLKYGNSLKVNGQSLPMVSEMTITDAKFENNKSVLIYKNPRLESHSDRIFNVNNLKR